MAQLNNLLVNGNSRFVGDALHTGAVDVSVLRVPSASGATVRTVGTNGQVLKSNGTSVYWGSDNNANYYHKTGTWSALTYTAAKVGSPEDLAFTIPTGTTASTVAVGNHTHTLTIATDSGTNQLTLAHNTKYKITAGGSSYVFTTPSDSQGVTSVTIKGTSPIVCDNETAITSTGTRTLSHATSGVTSGTYGTIATTALEPGYGGTFNVPAFTVDATGHVTSAGNHAVKIPASDNTDVKVTQTVTTTSANYEVLFSNTADNTTRTEGARKNNNLLFNPNTGNLQATKLNGVAIGTSPKFTDTTYSLGNSGESVTLTPSGGTAQSVSLSTLINGLSTGASDAQGADYLVAQYAGGGTTTTTYHRRPVNKIITKTNVDNALGKGSDTTKFYRNDGTWAVPPDTNYYHKTGSWSGFTYTAGKVGSPEDLAFTIPTGTTASTVAVGNHTHSYAGSSAAGGSANSAVKLDSNAGSATNPIYFSGGKPVSCTYSLNKTVPSDAVFTDTNYYHKTGTWSALTYTAGKVGSPEDLAFTIPTGTTASTVAVGNHTHTTTIATSSGTNQITLAHNTKYAITAGGTSYVFTTPSDTNTDTKVSQTVTTTANWRKVVVGYQSDSTYGAAVTAQTNEVYVSNKLEYQSSTGTLRGSIIQANRVDANISNSGNSGGLSLYSTDPTAYGVTMRNTGTSSGQLGKHGYVQGDWATYFTFNGDRNRGWIFREASTNVASIDGNGNGAFSGNLTVGANTTNTSGCRMEFNANTLSLDFSFA